MSQEMEPPPLPMADGPIVGNPMVNGTFMASNQSQNGHDLSKLTICEEQLPLNYANVKYVLRWLND